jgi:hypothetical protein
MLGLSLAAAGCKSSSDGSLDVSDDGGSSGRDGSVGGPRDSGMMMRDARMPTAGRDAATGDEDGGEEMMNVAVDPAPQRMMPGEYGCAGCPDADVTEFELDLGNATMHTFTGTVTDAEGNGQFYLESADGQTVGGVIPTDSTGGFEFTVPLFCGTQLLKCVWSNDVGQYVAVVQIITSDCVEADIRVTLTWDDKGSDFELHLIKEGGQINDNLTDCTWTSCSITSGPDWGVMGDANDNPRKDVDNTGTFGPENIYYASPESGTYTVMVEHWGAGTPDADGQVTINVIGEPSRTIAITDLTSHHVFTAGTIDWPSKAVVLDGAEYDCTANWSGGCRDAIP